MPKYPLSHRDEISAKRIVNRHGKGAKGAEAMAAGAKSLESKIKRETPVRSGELARSVTVTPVTRTDNPRMIVRTVKHGKFIEDGTKFIAPRKFIKGTAASTRRQWEKDASSAVSEDDS